MSDYKPLILVVDDNPQNIQVLGSLLMKQEYEIGVAQNGVIALEFIKERIPDLILLDIMMPEMDGLELCKSLKKNSHYSHIPVIFLTAKAETDDIVRGFEAGGVDYVTKPFVTAELLARVKAHLEIRYLRSLIPICSYCKKIRDDEGFWNRVEEYFRKHTNTSFSHGICEECIEKLRGEEEWF
ncbi:response regulator [Desulfopila sp. IMCC35008]|uniref:response regulator n=1 Tax=Desulfopila sp. IMCC35008 TaxID=2653858 RepID=UPI0013D10F6C|nr:response regulator [Desulfopila sp. IMCC35008]